MSAHSVADRPQTTTGTPHRPWLPRTFVVIIVMLIVCRSVVTTMVVTGMMFLGLMGARGIVSFLGYHEVFGLTTFATNMVVTLAIAAARSAPPSASDCFSTPSWCVPS